MDNYTPPSPLRGQPVRASNEPPLAAFILSASRPLPIATVTPVPQTNQTAGRCPTPHSHLRGRRGRWQTLSTYPYGECLVAALESMPSPAGAMLTRSMLAYGCASLRLPLAALTPISLFWPHRKAPRSTADAFLKPRLGIRIANSLKRV